MLKTRKHIAITLFALLFICISYVATIFIGVSDSSLFIERDILASIGNNASKESNHISELPNWPIPWYFVDSEPTYFPFLVKIIWGKEGTKVPECGGYTYVVWLFGLKIKAFTIIEWPK
ncbi:MAG: hypothetical protein AAB116_26940 [Candidatus Poribacteria bacterium]